MWCFFFSFISAEQVSERDLFCPELPTKTQEPARPTNRCGNVPRAERSSTEAAERE